MTPPRPVERLTGADLSGPVLLVTPYSLETNPYVRLLVRALRDEGLDVDIAGGRSPVLLWKALRWRRPRLVHLQWHHPYLNGPSLPLAIRNAILFLLQWATLRALGIPFVWTVHNLLEHERRHPRWELFACRALARLVDGLVAHCDAAAEEVAQAYRVSRERVRVVPHGVLELDDGGSVRDGERGELGTGGGRGEGAGAARISLREELGATPDDVLLLSFGLVRRYKGIDLLLDALRRGDPRLRLLVVGFADDPAYADELRQQAAGEPRVTLRLERVEDAELARLLDAADAVVLPYRHTLTSGAAVLAAAHGRAVIAPRLGCLRELGDDTAILYDPAEGGLDRALRRALAAPLEGMGATAARRIREQSWDRVGRETVAVYRAAWPRRRSEDRTIRDAP